MKQLLAFLAAACAATLAWAAPGHDHGPDASASAAQTAAPRFGTHSDAFELVGVLQGTTLVLYLDRYATNEPVHGARIEIEGEAVKGTATPADDGTYRVEAAALAGPGKHLMTFTITKDAEGDLLEAALEVPAAAATPAHDFHLVDYWPYGLAALLALAALAFLLLRKGKP
jgi:hypothetical protein